MAFRLLPKEFNYFELFDKLAATAVEAAHVFAGFAEQGRFDEVAIAEVRDIEHKGDELTHGIIQQLNITFITPFDREDIHQLAIEMDDIIDMINTMTRRMKIYKLSGAVNTALVGFAHVIVQSVEAVAKAVKGLSDMRKPKGTYESIIEINRLENVGDTMRDDMLEKLFETATDPLYVIKWKEIYQDAETVLDVCEDVANVVESIMVKQA